MITFLLLGILCLAKGIFDFEDFLPLYIGKYHIGPFWLCVLGCIFIGVYATFKTGCGC